MLRFYSVGTSEPDVRLLLFSAFRKTDDTMVNETNYTTLRYNVICI